jgi:hypothetical protein
MSIKKFSRKRASQSSNLTIRMIDDRMAFDRMLYNRMAADRMAEMRGPSSGASSIQMPSPAPADQNNSLQRSEDVDQENSSEKK